MRRDKESKEQRAFDRQIEDDHGNALCDERFQPAYNDPSTKLRTRP